MKMIKTPYAIAMEKMAKKVEELEQQLSEAERVVGFYANEWTSWEGKKIIPQDFEITEQNRPSGGKKAREYQQKYNVNNQKE